MVQIRVGRDNLWVEFFGVTGWCTIFMRVFTFVVGSWRLGWVGHVVIVIVRIADHVVERPKKELHVAAPWLLDELDGLFHR